MPPFFLFRIGRGRREAESFVSSFQPAFSLERKRILGDNVRVLKTFESKWQVHYVWPNKKGQLLIGAEDERPSYDMLLELLRRVPGSKSSQTWVERVLSTSSLANTNTLSTQSPKEEEVHLEGEANSETAQPANLQIKNASENLEQESVKLRLRPRTESTRSSSDRFAEENLSRDILHDPVMTLPEWPRQWLGNAFGKERVDEREGILKDSKQKRKPKKKQAKEPKNIAKEDQETESWVEEPKPSSEKNSIPLTNDPSALNP